MSPKSFTMTFDVSEDTAFVFSEISSDSSHGRTHVADEGELVISVTDGEMTRLLDSMRIESSTRVVEGEIEVNQ